MCLEFEKTVFEKLEKFNLELLEIKTVLSNLKYRDNRPLPDFTVIEQKLPITSEEELADFEEWVSVDANKQLTVRKTYMIMHTFCGPEL